MVTTEDGGAEERLGSIELVEMTRREGFDVILKIHIRTFIVILVLSWTFYLSFWTLLSQLTILDIVIHIWSC